MAATTLKRQWWQMYRCTPGMLSPHGFFGRDPIRAANQDVVEAWRALELAHIGSGYKPSVGGYIGTRRNCPAGIGGRTCEESGRNCSLHNYCIAIDVEYNYNKLGPYYPKRHTPGDVFVRDRHLHKYTPDQIAVIENVKTLSGMPVFRWLGWIGDYMHWEIDVPPEDLSIDWSTVPTGIPVPPPPKEEVIFVFPTLRKGDGLVSRDFGDRTHLMQEVAAVQAALRIEGFTDDNSHDSNCAVDGRFWTGTEAAVRAFQAARGLTADGIVGSNTYAALFREGESV